MSATHPLRQTIRSLSVATALTVIFSGSAFALDGNDVAKRIQARFADQGTVLQFGKVDTDGSTIVLRDTKVTMKTADLGELSLGDITLNDVTEDSEGGYLIETATMADVEKTDEDSTISIKGIEFGKLKFTADNNTDLIARMMYYHTMKADQLTIAQSGEQVVDLKDLYANSSEYTKGSPIKVDFGVKSAEIDIAKINEIEAKKKAAEPVDPEAEADAEANAEDAASPDVMRELGYDKLQGALTSTATWEPEKGDFSIDKFEFDMKDIAKFDLTAKLGGYDVKFLESVQQATKAMSDTKDGEDAATMAMLGLIQQLSLGEVSIRYDDASLTPKLLAFYGKQQGIDATAMANQIKGIAPLMIGYLGHADFAVQATTALNAYLDDPKSLTFSAKPKAPVPFSLIGASGMADPKSLLDLLNVKVDANQ